MWESLLVKLEKEKLSPIASEEFKNAVYYFDTKTRCVNILTRDGGNLAIDILRIRDFVNELIDVTGTYKEDINYA